MLWLPGSGGSAQTTSVTPAATNEGAILFHDDFSTAANGWLVGKTGYGEFDRVDDEFRVLLNKPDFNTYALLPARKFDNVSIEVDARLAAGPPNGVFGILCRAEANERTASKAYVFAIRTDGFSAILKRTSPAFWDAIVFDKKSKTIKPGDAVNHLRADCTGHTLTFYVNGEKLLQTTDDDFKTGLVGMAVTTQPGSAPMDVRFDNFVVRASAP
jgi:plastocyanin